MGDMTPEIPTDRGVMRRSVKCLVILCEMVARLRDTGFCGLPRECRAGIFRHGPRDGQAGQLRRSIYGP
jgi:hypothetical protein